MKTLKIIIALLLIVNLSNAQMQRGGPDGPNKEKLESMKIGFLTDRLNLSPEEAKVFWPVYNKYSDELDAIRKGRRDNLLNVKDNFDSMSDTEIEKAIDSEISSRSNEIDILRKYNPQFKKVLPMRKVAKLYKAEEDFKRKLVEMIRERRNNRGGQGGDDMQAPPPKN